MILHFEAARFIANLKDNREKLVLVELNAVTPVGSIAGSGTVELVKGRYHFVWHPSDDPASKEVLDHLRKEWGRPRVYTREHLWKFDGATQDGFHVEFDAFPPARWHMVNHRLTGIDFEAGRLRAVKSKWDPEEEAAFNATLEKIWVEAKTGGRGR